MTTLSVYEYAYACWQTLYTVTLSAAFGIVLGTLVGAWLDHTQRKTSTSARTLFNTANAFVNLGRSTPFILLMVGLLPLTRILVGTSIGVNAAVVPLSIAALPYFSRIVQSALNEIPTSTRLYVKSLGISPWQRYYRIYIPECRNLLIQGATLTLISLISYSTIAGAIGGGGIGQLAIDYGYQRFNPTVIGISILILFLSVQVLQYAGDHLCKRRHIRTPLWILAAWCVLCFGLYNAHWQGTDKKITRLGVMSGESVDIFKQLQSYAAKHYQLHYHVIAFDDYSLPNRALNDGAIDINLFQHKPFLIADQKAHHYAITPVITTFSYPLGFYSKKIKTLKKLDDGDVIAIANDATNQGRALQLLAKYHLITLNDPKNLLVNIHDISANPHHYQIVTLAAAQLPRTLQDASLVAINDDFLKAIHLQANHAIIREAANNPYANIAVVRQNEATDPEWEQWRAFLHSAKMIEVTQQHFPNGEAVPAWHQSHTGETT